MENKLTLLGHISELRYRLIVSLLVFCCSTAISFPFSQVLLNILRSPASKFIEKFVYFSPEGALTVYLRLCFFSGFIISFPFISYQLWLFISPAVTANFKKSVFLFTLFSLTAFLAGCLFAYFIFLPAALNFLFNIGKGVLVPVISANNYLSFVTTVILGCGIIFQLPVAIYILSIFGILSPAILRKNFKVAIIVMLIAAGIITPTTDIFNMLLFFLPMIILYEVSIWVSFLSRLKKEGK